jgi:hypothetical protein
MERIFPKNSRSKKNWSSGKKYEQNIVKTTFFDQCRWQRLVHGEADRAFGCGVAFLFPRVLYTRAQQHPS